MKKKNSWLWLAGGAVAVLVFYGYQGGGGSTDPFSEGSAKSNRALFI